jgi:hypothetical protein
VDQGIEHSTGASFASNYFGKTAALVESAQTASHFQKALLKSGDYLILLAVALVVLILATAQSSTRRCFRSKPQESGRCFA